MGDKPLSIKIPIDIVQRMQDDIEYGLGMRTPCDVMGFLIGRLSKEYTCSVVIREYVLTGYTNERACDRGGSGLWNDERLAEMIKASSRPNSQHYVVGLVRSSARGWPEIDKPELKAAKKLLKRTPNIFLLVHSGVSRTFTGRLFVRPTWRAKVDSEYGEFPLNSDILSAQWEATLPTPEEPSLHFVAGNPLHGRPRWQPPTPAQPPHIEVIFERVETPAAEAPAAATTTPMAETPRAEAPVAETRVDDAVASVAPAEAGSSLETAAGASLDTAAGASPSFATAIPVRERMRDLWARAFRRTEEPANPVEVPVEVPAVEPAAEPMPAELAPEPVAEIPVAETPLAETPAEAIPEPEPVAAAASISIEHEMPIEETAESVFEAPVETYEEMPVAEVQREPLIRRMMDKVLSYLIEEVTVEDLMDEDAAEPIAAESIEEESIEESIEEQPFESGEYAAAEQPHVIYSKISETEEFAGTTEESGSHAGHPWFGDNPPPPPPTHRLRSWLSMAATWTIAVGMTLWYLGGRNFFHHTDVRQISPAVVSNPVGLEVETSGGLLNITWDGTSATAIHARGGYLTIRDGSLLKEVSLDAGEVRTGHIYYESRNSDLGIRLELPQDSGQAVSESVRVVGPPPAARARK